MSMIHPQSPDYSVHIFHYSRRWFCTARSSSLRHQQPDESSWTFSFFLFWPSQQLCRGWSVVYSWSFDTRRGRFLPPLRGFPNLGCQEEKKAPVRASDIQDIGEFFLRTFIFWNERENVQAPRNEDWLLIWYEKFVSLIEDFVGLLISFKYKQLKLVFYLLRKCQFFDKNDRWNLDVLNLTFVN